MALGRWATTPTTMALARARQEWRGQRFVAFGIKIGIRLVEYDQKRIAIQRARQRNALGLTGGQRAGAIADRGFIAVGQIDDEVVERRLPAPPPGRLRGGRIFETRDVLRDISRK